MPVIPAHASSEKNASNMLEYSGNYLKRRGGTSASSVTSSVRPQHDGLPFMTLQHDVFGLGKLRTDVGGVSQ